MIDKNILLEEIDCVECALIPDEDFQQTVMIAADEELDDDLDEVVDANVDYSDDVPEVTIEDMDADDIIAAERDIAHNPMDEDELIDIATGGDDDVIFDDEDLEE